MKTARTALDMGKLIKYHRQKKNLSQSELAQKCHLTQASLSNIENGVGGTLKVLEKILRALEVEICFQEISKINNKKNPYFVV